MMGRQAVEHRCASHSDRPLRTRATRIGKMQPQVLLFAVHLIGSDKTSNLLRKVYCIGHSSQHSPNALGNGPLIQLRVRCQWLWMMKFQGSITFNIFIVRLREVLWPGGWTEFLLRHQANGGFDFSHSFMGGAKCHVGRG